MTGNEANKQLAADFCRLYTEGSWDELEKLLGEDFRWRQPTSQRRQSPALAVCCDGVLAELREYQDTLLLYDVWMAP